MISETSREEAILMIGNLLTSQSTSLISERQAADDIFYALTGQHLKEADFKELDIPR